MASVQAIYVALFARPADPAGYDYFQSVTHGGGDLSPIFGTLTGTAEYQGRFLGMDTEHIINSIYRSLFNRNVDSAGADFFSAQLSSGRQTIETIAINILDGAAGSDEQAVTNKLAAADAYMQALKATPDGTYSGDFGVRSGQDYLRLVGSSSATVPSADKVKIAISDLSIKMDGDDAVVSVRNGPQLQSTNIPAGRATIDTILAGDSGLTDATRDNITGFKSGIDLMKFGGPAGSAASYVELGQSFSSIDLAKSAADTAMDGHVQYVMTDFGADKVIFVDSNADGVADISAKFIGLAEFSMFDIA